MTFPTIHLNGSGRKILEEQCYSAVQALRLARQAIVDMEPHGRDYYTQDDCAYGRARHAHERRYHAITAVLKEVQTIHEFLVGES
jgi:hypothetical protein